MGEGRRTQVMLLDERRLDIVVQPKLTVEELLNIVASHCHLRDPDKHYFGLTFLDDRQQYHWLYRQRCVLDHDFPKKMYLSGVSIILYHMIKFYVHSVSQLAYSPTVELYFLQVQQHISRGYFQVDSKSMFRLSGYAMQAYFGDYVNESVAKNRMKRLPLFPASLLKEYPSLAHCEDKLTEIYKSLFGMSRGAAILNYMSLVEKMENYGMHFYEVKEKSGASVLLGLCSKGLYQFDVNDPAVTRQVRTFSVITGNNWRTYITGIESFRSKFMIQNGM
ncbi:unnamed protein product [Soboliphyme baturini]|uniref:FERM domain-containing protein n=1 Tax=Soboliphyme baturini TaxID=241478 RepID=A0A183IMA0_9BILA|nr:unnamed protein product [Soboliphyme baturini]